jgi:hypothetical protein
MKLKTYMLEEVSKRDPNTPANRGFGETLYKVANYDGDAEKLKEEFDEWKEGLDFWYSAYLKIRDNEAFIELEIDPLD